MNQIISEHIEKEHENFRLLYDFARMNIFTKFEAEVSKNVHTSKHQFILIEYPSFIFESVLEKGDILIEFIIEENFINFNFGKFITYEWSSGLLKKYKTSDKNVKWTNNGNLLSFKLKHLNKNYFFIFDITDKEFDAYDFNLLRSDYRQIVIRKEDLSYSNNNGKDVIVITNDKIINSEHIIRETVKIIKNPIKYKPDF